jgi:hypothetical protein
LPISQSSYFLEIELIDIVLGEDERLAEEDRILGNEFELAEPAGFDIAGFRIELVLELCVDDIDGAIADVDRAPQGRLLE